NSVNVHGDVCPLLDRAGLSCPLLCVRDFGNCPAAIKPASCGAGQQLCDDGSCHDSCDGVTNPCLCGFSSSAVTNVYKSCPAYDSTVVVRNYNPSIKGQQIEFACAQAWGVISRNSTIDDGSGIAAWISNATDPMLWNSCPTPQEPKLSFKENFCLAFYGVIAAEIALYLMWHIYKSIRERHAASLRQVCSTRPTTTVAANGVTSELDKNTAGLDSLNSGKHNLYSDPLDAKLGVALTPERAGTNPKGMRDAKNSAAALPDGMMLLRGFDANPAGAALYYLALLSTAGWLVLLAVIVADYYGAVKGGVAYGLLASSNTSMYVFVFVWHLGGLWMIAMLACMSKLRNYFRIECALPAAHVVQVEQRQAEVILMEGEHNQLTDLVNRARDALTGRFHLDISAETCRMQRLPIGSSGASSDPSALCSFIEYRCTRYVLDERTGVFQSHLFSLGSNHRELLANRGGLCSAEAMHRGSHIGENFIRVAVPSAPLALLQEFFSFFYLYQLMCMWVWFYFNYYKMALVQFGVIIISAFIKVAIRLRSEHKVKSLAEHKSECRARRDGQWITLNTADLVPGDVVAVQAGMDVMCDGCVLQGEVVVDESSLTGEAMPVRKLPLKEDTIPYEAAGAGKIYSVFAGTRVLQCTGSLAALSSQSQPTLL
ncbi:hypothetical protein GGI04_005322, partial [Coemansia thaxteri]